MKTCLALAAVVMLAACGNDSRNSAATDQPSAESTSQSAPEKAAASAADQGRRHFSQCAVCHSVQPDDPARVGPNLFGVYGRSTGSGEDFTYSAAMRDADIVWNDETLDAFIENPQSYIPGNRMAFAGQKDAQKRAEIIAYLKTLSDDAD